MLATINVNTFPRVLRPRGWPRKFYESPWKECVLTSVASNFDCFRSWASEEDCSSLCRQRSTQSSSSTYVRHRRGGSSVTRCWNKKYSKYIKNSRQSSHGSFSLKVMSFYKAKKIIKFFGHFCKKNFHQELWKKLNLVTLRGTHSHPTYYTNTAIISQSCISSTCLGTA